MIRYQVNDLSWSKCVLVLISTQVTWHWPQAPFSKFDCVSTILYCPVIIQYFIRISSLVYSHTSWATGVNAVKAKMLFFYYLLRSSVFLHCYHFVFELKCEVYIMLKHFLVFLKQMHEITHLLSHSSKVQWWKSPAPDKTIVLSIYMLIWPKVKPATQHNQQLFIFLIHCWKRVCCQGYVHRKPGSLRTWARCWLNGV